MMRNARIALDNVVRPPAKPALFDSAPSGATRASPPSPGD
jgi:hypothetical protein